MRLAEVSRWIISSEDNIRLLRTLELKIDSAPDRDIASLAMDHFQANTWYATSGERLFRTTNNAAGWEELLNFAPGKRNPSLYLEQGMENPPSGQTLKKVCPSPYKKGLVALAGVAKPTKPTIPLRSYVYLSTDCGESWLRLTDIGAEIDDMDWLQLAGRHILLLATSSGLKELHLKFGARGNPGLEISYPIPVIDPKKETPVYAVKVLAGRGGTARVAVAWAQRGGVHLSTGVNLNQTGAFTGLEHDNTDRVPPDIRCLGLQWSEQDNRFLLWAGGMALGPQDSGCCYWVLDQQLNLILDQSQYSQEQGKGHWFKDGWAGGSCLGFGVPG